MKRRTSLLIIDGLTLLVMLVLCALQFNVSVPSGSLHINVISLVVIVLVTLTDVTNALITVAIALAIATALHIVDWQVILQTVLMVLLGIGIMVTRLPHHQRLSHQQAIWLGLAVGICQVLMLTAYYLIFGWLTLGNIRGAFVEIQQVFPAAILSGLLDALLIPAFFFAGTQIADKLGLFNNPDQHGKEEVQNDPPIIDLSPKKKDHQDSDKKQ